MQDFDQLLGNMPEEERKTVQLFALSMQMNRVVSPEAELMRKMSPENIDTFLEGQKDALDYDFKEKRDNKIFQAVIVIGILVFIIALTILLKDYPETLEKVICTVLGAVGGYGYGKTKRERNRKAGQRCPAFLMSK